MLTEKEDTPFKVGEVYKNGLGDSIVIVHIGDIEKVCKALGTGCLGKEKILGYNINHQEHNAFQYSGQYSYSTGFCDLIPPKKTKTITVDGKDIEISEESFRSFKEQFKE